MKHLFRTLGVLALAAMMAVSSMIIVSAETSNQEEETSITIAETDDGSKAYELVWKYKEEFGHLYRRRWNMTLGEWYDPAWILVY